MSHSPQEKSARDPISPSIDRALWVIGLVACISLVAYKFVLTRLLNINWDEFYFLSLVYTLARGELSLLLLGAYTHLYSWLPAISGGEIEQIMVARYLMTALLGLTAWLVWRLARVWLSGSSALIPPLVYLSSIPVLQHGGSFRFDSMLAPLSVAAILLLVGSHQSPRKDWLAGALLGVAFAVTVKVVLFAPLLLVAACFRDAARGDTLTPDWRQVVATLFRLAGAAGTVAAILLALHALTIVPSAADSLANFASNSARTTLLETPWFPRAAFLERYLHLQTLMWLLMVLGAVIAVARRRFALASLFLALLPIAFYRNTFPYYYVVMLAPASVLAGYALRQLVTIVRSYAANWVASLLLYSMWAALLFQGLAPAVRWNFDDVWVQRIVLSGVHQIFPQPVNYIDRCGMVPSFRKVNFFMSTWGMQDYRARNRPFMPPLLRDARPAFILINAAALSTNAASAGELIDADRDLIERFYPPYWGPVRVAGARALLSGSTAVKVAVPFPASYRLDATEPVLIDGMIRSPGDVIEVGAAGVSIQATNTGRAASQPINVKLFLAAAGKRPDIWLAPQPLFAGL